MLHGISNQTSILASDLELTMHQILLLILKHYNRPTSSVSWAHREVSGSQEEEEAETHCQSTASPTHEKNTQGRLEENFYVCKLHSTVVATAEERHWIPQGWLCMLAK